MIWYLPEGQRLKVHRYQLKGRSLCSIRLNRKWRKRKGSLSQNQGCFFVCPISDSNLKNLWGDSVLAQQPTSDFPSCNNPNLPVCTGKIVPHPIRKNNKKRDASAVCPKEMKLSPYFSGTASGSNVGYTVGSGICLGMGNYGKRYCNIGILILSWPSMQGLQYNETSLEVSIFFGKNSVFLSVVIV